mmetsp:Transcript_26377/g.48192  ORF Transcript_26377/g.48192 Transcript_26377/m.48192 type:complete len:238 (-) Transcript_26377:1409-2122(-)
MQIPPKAQMPQVCAFHGQLQQQDCFLVGAWHKARSSFAGRTLWAIHDLQERLQQAVMASHVCGDHELNDEVADLTKLLLWKVFAKVALWPSQDSESSGDVMVLIHMLVIVEQRARVCGPHQEVIRKPHMLKVMHRCRQQASQHQFHARAFQPGPIAGKDCGCSTCNAAKLQKCVHCMHHGCCVRLVVVGIGRTVAGLNLAKELLELVLIQAEVLNQAQVRKEVHAKRTQRPPICDPL